MERGVPIGWAWNGGRNLCREEIMELWAVRASWNSSGMVYIPPQPSRPPGPISHNIQTRLRQLLSKRAEPGGGRENRLVFYRRPLNAHAPAIQQWDCPGIGVIINEIGISPKWLSFRFACKYMKERSSDRAAAMVARYSGWLTVTTFDGHGFRVWNWRFINSHKS